MNPAILPTTERHLWFDRAGVRFAAGLQWLQEVLPLRGLRRLPATEPSLAGLMILREFIVPVFDPVLMVGAAAVPVPGQANVVVLRSDNRPMFAVIAERVGQVVPLPPAGPTAVPLRLPAAFAGEVQLAGQKRLLVLNVPEFAAAMGLIKSNAPEFSPAA